MNIKRLEQIHTQELGRLFNLYRIFYEQPSDQKLALKFINERMDMNESIVFIEKLLVELKWLDPAGEAKILVALLDGISIQYLCFKQDYPLDELE